jgi:glycosyltransferase involved in cell wall biosynthesis
MAQPSPIVSIIIPTKDRADLLMETLASCQAQTDTRWEAIVVDDGSKDDSKSRVLSLADARVRFESLPTGKSGAPAGRNYGSSIARGEFIIFLDSDDLLAPHCIEQRIRLLQENPELDFAVFPCELFRKSPGDVTLLWNCAAPEDDLDRMLKMDVVWQTTSPIWRKSSLAKFSPWDEEVKSGQDWEYHIRAIVAGLKYQRFANRDCFWRMADAERDSIGKQSFGKEHLKNREPVIVKMLSLIREKNLLTDARRAMFAGMYFQCAERMATRVSRRDGRMVWKRAFDAGLITVSEHRRGDRYLAMLRFPRLAKWYRSHLERSWNPLYFVKRTSTYLRTPLEQHDDLSKSNIGNYDPRGHLFPTISIVMSAYNTARYLRESLDSIVEQTFRDFECIIIDDGSTDDTLKILREYEARDPRFKIISRPNTGLTRALNEALSHARGEFIARMDGDDIAMPDRFEKQIGYMREHPECVLLGSRVELIDPYSLRIALGDYMKLTHEEIDAMLLQGKGGSVVHPSCIMRRDAVEKVGRYKEQYNNSEDLDLFLRLAEVGKVANLPDVLLKYRRHLESVSHQKYENQWKLKTQIVRDAYERRGQKMPENWTFTPWKPKPILDQLKEWAWMALKSGNVQAARKYAVDVFKRSPFSGESWKLMYCALRGR